MNISVKITAFCLLISASGVFAQAMDLSSAERIGLKNNFDLRVLRMEQRLIDESLKATRRDYFPSVALTYRHNNQVGVRDFDNGTDSMQISLVQPIFNGGRTKLSHDIAKINKRLSREDYRWAIQTMRFNIRKSYLDLQLTRAALLVSKRNLKNIRKIADRGERELRQGLISELDSREIRNELERRRLDHRKAIQNFEDKREDFAHLLRIAPEKLPELALLDLNKLQFRPLDTVSQKLEALSVRYSPELRKSRIGLAKSKKQYMITKYRYLPKVSIAGHYGKTGDEWPPRTTEWGFGLNFSFDFLSSSFSNITDSNYNSDQNERTVSNGGEFNLYDQPGWRKPHIRNSIELMKARRNFKDAIRNNKVHVRRSIREFRNREADLSRAEEALKIAILRLEIKAEKFQRKQITPDKFFEEELDLFNARLALLAQRTEFVLLANRLELRLGLALDSLGLVDLNGNHRPNLRN